MSGVAERAGWARADAHFLAERFHRAEQVAEKVVFVVEEFPQGLKPQRIFNVLRHD
jgi:hypothetical protein